MVRAGYKHTEIGVIPEDWSPTRIGDITTKVGSGITPRGGDANYLEEGRPFVRSQNVGWGTLLLDDLVYIDDSTHQSFDATELREGDVLLNITGASIGRCAAANSRLAGGNVNQHVCIVRVAPNAHVPALICQYVLSAHGQRQIDSFQAGGNRQGLNFAQVRAIQLPLPHTKAEQEAIAGALSDADALIESLEELIAKRRQIKQGTMQELLTGKTRLPGFTGEWEVKRLGDAADTDPEALSSNTDPGFAFKYIALEDVEMGSLRGYTELLFSGAPSRARRKLRQSDVLVSTVRPNLKAHLLFELEDDAWICSTGFCVVRCRKPLSHPGFVLNQMFSDHVNRQINSLLAGSSYPAISSTDVRALEIPFPPYDEQTAIAAVLSDMDAEISALETKLQKARQIKQGMMQELLTGRIRLVESGKLRVESERQAAEGDS